MISISANKLSNRIIQPEEKTVIKSNNKVTKEINGNSPQFNELSDIIVDYKDIPKETHQNVNLDNDSIKFKPKEEVVLIKETENQSLPFQNNVETILETANFNENYNKNNSNENEIKQISAPNSNRSKIDQNTKRESSDMSKIKKSLKSSKLSPSNIDGNKVISIEDKSYGQTDIDINPSITSDLYRTKTKQPPKNKDDILSATYDTFFKKDSQNVKNSKESDDNQVSPIQPLIEEKPSREIKPEHPPSSLNSLGNELSKKEDVKSKDVEKKPSQKDVISFKENELPVITNKSTFEEKSNKESIVEKPLSKLIPSRFDLRVKEEVKDPVLDKNPTEKNSKNNEKSEVLNQSQAEEKSIRGSITKKQNSTKNSASNSSIAIKQPTDRKTKKESDDPKISLKNSSALTNTKYYEMDLSSDSKDKNNDDSIAEIKVMSTRVNKPVENTKIPDASTKINNDVKKLSGKNLNASSLNSQASIKFNLDNSIEEIKIIDTNIKEPEKLQVNSSRHPSLKVSKPLETEKSEISANNPNVSSSQIPSKSLNKSNENILAEKSVDNKQHQVNASSNNPNTNTNTIPNIIPNPNLNDVSLSSAKMKKKKKSDSMLKNKINKTEIEDDIDQNMKYKLINVHDKEEEFYNQKIRDFEAIFQTVERYLINRRRNGILSNSFYKNYILKEISVLDKYKKNSKIFSESFEKNLKEFESTRGFDTIFKSVIGDDNNNKAEVIEMLKKSELKNSRIGAFKKVNALSAYYNLEKPEFKSSYEKFTSEVAYVRDIKCDGDSYFRAFMFSLLEYYILNQNIHELKKIVLDIYNMNGDEDTTFSKMKGIDFKIVLVIFHLIIDHLKKNNIQKAYEILINAYFLEDISFDLVRIK